MVFFRKISQWYFSKRALPYWCLLLIDCAIVAVSIMVSYYILNGGNAVANNFWELCVNAVAAALVYAVFFKVFHTYSGVVRYSSFIDLWRIAAACFCGMLVCAAGVAFCRFHELRHEVLIFQSYFGAVLTCGFSMLLMMGVRVLVKMLHDAFRISATSKTAYVYGIKAGGVGIAKAIRNGEPVKYVLKGFVQPDDDTDNVSWLMGVPVVKDDAELVDYLKENHIQVLIVSPMQAEHFTQREELVDSLIQEGIVIVGVGGAEEWDGKTDLRSEQIRTVEVEDLLPREKIDVDMDKIGEFLTGKTVMITGAAGSIGSEMARQVAKFSPKAMVLVDQAETPMHDVRLMMASKYPSVACETIVSSITNQPKMEAVFAAYRPDYVFHAAAYKHVPMMEDNPSEAVQNNVRGTRVIADLAVKYGTKKFVMISTDKAVNPTNVMGCSKRICEIYCQSLNQAIVDGKVEGVTQFVTTRFGNVLGSNGSVIPLFREQIAKGGPLTVTHPDIIRYFMLIPEACKLVLEAGTLGNGGEIFVFDMGKPVRIVDLAKRMIKLSGAKDIEIKFSGLRDGEKLYEEVLSDKENTVPTVHPKIMVAQVRKYDYADACANEDRLLAASYTFDDMATVKVMKEIVPEYKSQVSKYQVLDQ